MRVCHIAIFTISLFLVTHELLSDPVVIDSATSLVGHTEKDIYIVAQTGILRNYLDYFFGRVHGKWKKNAIKLIPKVIDAAQKENLDPLLLAVVISCESTWRMDATGKIGEVGLMQVHGEAARGFDTSTIEGNLAAGARWLASRIEKYGSLERGMMAYMGFNDRAKRAAAWRLKAYYRERERQGLPPL